MTLTLCEHPVRRRIDPLTHRDVKESALFDGRFAMKPSEKFLGSLVTDLQPAVYGQLRVTGFALLRLLHKTPLWLIHNFCHTRGVL